jgi:hypothetical protein
MPDSIDNQLVSDVARELVLQLAPQELPLFRANSAAYFQDPEKALAGQKGKDEMLGFGSGEVVVFLTPIALTVATEVVKFLVEEVKKSAKDESSAIIGDMVKRVFKKFKLAEKKDDKKKDEKKTSPALTPDQLGQVRDIALRKARQLKLSEARAKLLADAVVGSLAVNS